MQQHDPQNNQVEGFEQIQSESSFSAILSHIAQENRIKRSLNKTQANIQAKQQTKAPIFINAKSIKKQSEDKSIKNIQLEQIQRKEKDHQHKDKDKNDKKVNFKDNQKKLQANSKGSFLNGQIYRQKIKDLEEIGQKCGYGGGLNYSKRKKQGKKSQSQFDSDHQSSQLQEKYKQNQINKQQFFQTQKNIKERLQQHIKKNEKNYQDNNEFRVNVKQKITEYNPQDSKFKSDSNYVIQQSLIHTQKKIQIQDIDVYFPYDPYEAQIAYMNQTILALKNQKNALLQSPTGTGKTLCLLSSTLAWAQSFYKQKKQQVKIIYLSRTHSQIAQVQNELKKTCYRPTIATFGSREQLCIKEELSQLKGRDKVQACSKGIKLYLRYGRQPKVKLEYDKDETSQKNYQNQKEDIQNSNILSKLPLEERRKVQSSMCTYYRSQNYVLNLAKYRFKKKLITVQELKNVAKNMQFCPYYYPMHIKPICNLYFMPYNYLLDDTLFSRYADILQKSIVIFDQGHNVPQASCQGRSYSIFGRTFQDALKELEKNLKFPKASAQLANVRYSYGKIMNDLLVQFKSIYQTIKYYLKRQSFLTPSYQNQNQQQRESIKVYPPHMNYQCIYQIFYEKVTDIQANIFNQNPTQMDHINLMSKFQKKMSPIITSSLQLCQALQETHDGIYQNIEKAACFLKKCVQLVTQNPSKKDWIDVQLNHYRIKIIYNSQKIWQFQLVCLVPFLTFKKIKQIKPRSIIITSGTLTPLKAWTGQLRIPFQIQFSNIHVIRPNQLQLRILTTGLLRNNMNFSFQSLKNEGPNIYQDLIKTICFIAASIPNGILVILPSYKIMTQIQKHLNKHLEVFNSLVQLKTVFFEVRNHYQALIKNYKKAALKQPGALLFCVCRGKISEGIDFPNQLCRSVIFVGVPYPNIKDVIIGQKRDHLDTIKKKYGGQFISGSQWYDINTIRAVNQGIGRVIRHINDYGTIFLIDSRYTWPKLKNGLSSWVHKSLIIVNNIDKQQLDEDIRLFYNLMRKQFKKQSNKEEQSEPIYQIQKQSIKVRKNAFDVLMSKKNLKKSAK